MRERLILAGPDEPRRLAHAGAASLALHGACAVALVIAAWHTAMPPSGGGPLAMEVVWAPTAGQPASADSNEAATAEAPAEPPAAEELPAPAEAPPPPPLAMAAPEAPPSLVPPPPALPVVEPPPTPMPAPALAVAAPPPPTASPVTAELPPGPSEIAIPPTVPPPPVLAEAPPAAPPPPVPTRATPTSPAPPQQQIAARTSPPPTPRVATASAPRRTDAPPRPAVRRTADGGGQASEGPVNAAPPAPTGPILMTNPRYRRPPTPPVYPHRARELGITGTVLVRALVSPDGETKDSRVQRSSGNPLLDGAAVEAVRRWAFEPATHGGRHVEAWVEIPIHFRLQ